MDNNTSTPTEPATQPQTPPAPAAATPSPQFAQTTSGVSTSPVPQSQVMPAPAQNTDDALKWVVPIHRTGLSIAAGYLGLFTISVIPAPIALIVGILALRELKKRPDKLGRGRAWFGTIMGALGTLLILAIFIANI